jgi:hypothetical protein
MYATSDELVGFGEGALIKLGCLHEYFLGIAAPERAGAAVGADRRTSAPVIARVSLHPVLG